MPTQSAKTPLQERFSRTRDDDRKLAALARQQHGVIARWQLLKRGWSETAIDKRIRAGRFHRVHAGVYAVGHQVIPREGRWMAAVLASGPDAVLSHWSAAALWGIRPNGRTLIDVTVPRRSRSSDQIRRHISKVPADERAVKDGIPLTSAARTIFDLAVTEDLDAVEAMLREMEFLRCWGPLSLHDLVERYPGKRGSRKVRAALERLKEEPEGRKRSKLEERFAPFLRRHHLPQPRFNDSIPLGAKRYQVDCHWPGTGQIVELDGWEGHGTKSAFREDRGRDRKLRVAGYSVTRLTWSQLDDEPEAIASDLQLLLGDR
ncbi:MAG TPA: type IV toxin-antitoxin system AbiEi family antitoxin domain-containing protein [Solirubrobacterales bacterium]|nr:type IV toxin-antitoxin system AbiEi family antitoxin domain-containing protein [Solirubrobacterales bacterium]